MPSSLLRELHVYGSVVPLGERSPADAQHHGLGSRLLSESERISREFGRRRLVVISGVGTREYLSKAWILGRRPDHTFQGSPSESENTKAR